MAGAHDNALIIFTREPEACRTKTRMMPYLSPEECAELHSSILRDIAEEMSELAADIYVCFTSSDGECPVLHELYSYARSFFPQNGDGLGVRMYNAMSRVLSMGYRNCALIGTDIPSLNREAVEDAYRELAFNDVVLGPTDDGGYCLIAMKRPSRAPFEVGNYGCDTVLDNTVKSIEAAGLTVTERGCFHDVDDRMDLAFYRSLLRQKNSMSTHFSRFVWEHLKVSVIIPIYNEETTIESMLSQLEPHRDEIEVILVDGGSTDRTLELINDRYRIIHAEKGRALQQNAGAEAAKGDIILFLHCDSILPDNWLDELREVACRSDYGCFGVSFPSRHILMITNTVISNYRAFVRGIPFCDQGVFLERTLFDSMGGFPELPIHEDYQFSLNMREAGYRPARTRHRITTSIRRYGDTTWSIIKTEFMMWNIRRKYLKGVPAEVLAEEYRDIR